MTPPWNSIAISGGALSTTLCRLYPHSRSSRRSIRASIGGGWTFAPVSSTARGLRSEPTPIRPAKQASRGVVPLPENGSRTKSPSREHCSMKYRGKAGGNIAKYEHIECHGCPHLGRRSFHQGASHWLLPEVARLLLDKAALQATHRPTRHRLPHPTSAESRTRRGGSYP